MKAARPAPLKRNHREQLFRFQAHALTHLFKDCASDCGGIPKTAEWSHLLCPLCLDFFELSKLTEDHAPPSGGQSRLGGRHITVLVCRPCNHAAGKTFEGHAAYTRKALTPPARDFCDVHNHGRHWTRPSGLEVPVDYASLDLTDAKAAYLLAFATLGYRWVLSQRLNELRSAFAESRVCSDWVIADHDPQQPNFVVLEVESPTPRLVVSNDRVEVHLPCESSNPNLSAELETPTGRVADGPISHPGQRKQRPFKWPITTIGPSSGPEKTWDHSPFFALDRCDSVEHTHVARASALDVQALLGRASEYWIGKR